MIHALALSAATFLSTLAPSEHSKPGFAGTWMTSFGPMELEGKKAKLKGSYGFAQESRIEGEVDGNRFTFEWRGANGGGKGWFELWEEGDVFLGEYSSNGGEGGKWGGYRKARELAKPQPGDVVVGQGECGLIYHLRAPKGWKKSKPVPALMFFHGSNMTSRSYVDTIVAAFPKLADDYMLIGVDGEQIGTESTPDNRYYNFTYVEFSGPKVGEPWRYNQSPELVAQLVRELGKEHGIERWFVGGHSQGGFLTYAMVMFYPELFDGAFPMSCNLLVQCEPSYFDDEELIAKQRKVAIAHVHGENDPLVEFSSGEYCYEAMQDGGIEALRLFAHPSAGHKFALLPVEEAVRWLEGVTSDDPKVLAECAERSLEEQDPRGAIAAVRRAIALDPDQADDPAFAKLSAQIESSAAAEAERLAKLIEKDSDNAWVDDFWEFRRQYAYAPCAQECMERYAKLRKKHAKPADDLFYAARSETDAGRKREKQQQIVDEYYASKWYKLVRRWLE